MATDRHIDWTTRDHVAAGPGWRLDDPLLNQVLISWSVPLGSWEAAPELGHEFGELERWTAGAAAADRLRELALAAIQWLLEDGTIERAEIDADVFGGDALVFEARLWPRGQLQPLRTQPFRVAVGGR